MPSSRLKGISNHCNGVPFVRPIIALRAILAGKTTWTMGQSDDIGRIVTMNRIAAFKYVIGIARAGHRGRKLDALVGAELGSSSIGSTLFIENCQTLGMWSYVSRGVSLMLFQCRLRALQGH